MDRYNKLKAKHKAFTYHDYEILENSSGLRFKFHFSLDNIHFNPSWSYNEPLPPSFKYRDALEYAVFNLGMAELVSYWKCACPNNVYINCGALNHKQAEFWKKLYLKGLGEFFYKNNISPSNDFIKIIPKNTTTPEFEPINDLNGTLIPVGGGKDSIVSMELLCDSISDNKCYIINPRGPVIATAVMAGYKETDIVGVRRIIDSGLIRLNSEGYLNGHTPFSAIVAFSSFIFALIHGKKYIALSNESSANEANVAGTDINHQYSKSTEFERDFREYIKNIFGGYPEYFSLLRPLSEFQITKKFASYPQYLNIFQSCNIGSKTDTWCGKCAKCLYVYIMLAAFLPDEKLISVFGLDMLDDTRFAELFNSLVYPSLDKPFECVGTKNEICLALHYANEKRKQNPPALLRLYFASNPEKPDDLNNYFDDDNYVPKEFLCLID